MNKYLGKKAEINEAARLAKHDLLVRHPVHDKYLLRSIQDFIVMVITFLSALERMHKGHILIGNINPYAFMYNKKRRSCEPIAQGVLSAQHEVYAEKKAYDNLVYINTDVANIPYNRYLAPELRESVRVYSLQHRLLTLLDEAKSRRLTISQEAECKQLIQDFHKRLIRYSNRAEIYSAGYTINQILSHTLSKLAHLGLRMHEFVTVPIAAEIVQEAELLLPDYLDNPSEDRILGIVNEAIEYITDLMQEHMEERDSLKTSIEKFKSLLKRSTTTRLDDYGEEWDGIFASAQADLENTPEEIAIDAAIIDEILSEDAFAEVSEQTEPILQEALDVELEEQGQSIGVDEPNTNMENSFANDEISSNEKSSEESTLVEELTNSMPAESVDLTSTPTVTVTEHANDHNLIIDEYFAESTDEEEFGTDIPAQETGLSGEEVGEDKDVDSDTDSGADSSTDDSGSTEDETDDAVDSKTDTDEKKGHESGGSDSDSESEPLKPWRP